MKMKFKIIIIGILGIGLSLIVFRFHQGKRDLLPIVKVEEIKRGEIITSIDGIGKVKPAVEKVIKAQVGGIIDEVLVKEGSKVHVGQILVKLNSLEIEEEIIHLENKVGEVEFELKRAKQNLIHAQDLFNIEAISKVGLESAQLQLIRIEESLDSAIKMRNLAYIKKKKTIIQSPIEGIVILKPKGIDIDTRIEPDEFLMVIGNMKSLIVEADIDESSCERVKIGQQAIITTDTKYFHGKVKRVGLQIHEVEGKFKLPITISIDSPANLKIGNIVNVEIITDYRKSTLFVPIEAIIHKEDKKIVLIVKDGIVKEMPVEIGISNLNQVEILSGNLQEGDLVIISQHHKLAEGKKVKIKK